MSMFKKIKKIFIEEDPNEKVEPKEELSDEQIVNEIPTIEEEAEVEIQQSETPPIMTAEKPEVDKKSASKFVNILLKAIDSNNMEGFDYLEFKTALQNLSSMDMDEGTKYQSTMAMAKTMNVGSKDIISSAERYLNVLQQEKNKFNNAVQRQRKLKVDDKETEIVDRRKLIEQKKKQIEQLKKEIELETKKLEEIKGGINQEAAKVQATFENFNYAYQQVSGQIATDIENLKKYVG